MLYYRLLALILIIKIIKSSVVADEISNYLKMDNFRLPNNTYPISYNLHMTTNIHKGDSKFDGTVEIVLKALENTNYIVIHSYQLKYIKIALIDLGTGIEFQNASYVTDTIKQTIVIYSSSQSFELEQGKLYSLIISYRGLLSDGVKGFCANCFDKDNKGNDICIASTHFQPIFARSAFPCYDEPMLKAKFKISITHGDNYTAISNMPSNGKPFLNENGMITTKFQETPLLSTYTLAFVVSNFKNISLKKNNITHRIFSPPEAKSRGEFPLNISMEILTKLEDYFGINYPLPKIDHISVPHHIGSAMENWGLIIYKQGKLLPYSKTSKYYNLRLIETISHEITHQWFGNLITPKWWSYAWLSEGITTYYSLKILDMLYPDIKAMEYGFNIEGIHIWYAKELPPMTAYRRNHSEVLKSFKYSYYMKGFFLMQMLEHSLGETTLQKGVIKFLKKFQYSSVDENDLFECIQIAAIQDKISIWEEEGIIKKIMNSWTQQENLPMVIVTRNYENGTFTIGQTLHEKENLLWWIPINFATASEPDFHKTKADFIFPNETQIIINPHLINRTILAEDWLILNKQQIVPYRIMYDEQNWDLIIAALKKNPKSIHTYNRIQLLRDTAYFTKRSMLPWENLRDLFEYLINEKDIVVWNEAIKILNDLYYELDNNLGILFFNFFARNLTANIYKDLGTNIRSEDSPIAEEVRGKLFNFICNIELVNCTNIVKEKIEFFINDAELYDPFMRVAIFCEFLKDAKENEIKEFAGKLNERRLSSYDEGKSYLMPLFSCRKYNYLAEFLLNYLDISLKEFFAKLEIE